jgi:hypothetical protein
MASGCPYVRRGHFHGPPGNGQGHLYGNMERPEGTVFRAFVDILMLHIECKTSRVFDKVRASVGGLMDVAMVAWRTVEHLRGAILLVAAGELHTTV